ncbi:hypothetical protein AB6A40_001598 [Gnathostoma spinigerum]|uniref:Uncharacterized protein n=1 Tax=Gnathostoma spinigerum TaxID=75299 RepID=A0ABD6E9R6_9BILA
MDILGFSQLRTTVTIPCKAVLETTFQRKVSILERIAIMAGNIYLSSSVKPGDPCPHGCPFRNNTLVLCWRNVWSALFVRISRGRRMRIEVCLK